MIAWSILLARAMLIKGSNTRGAVTSLDLACRAQHVGAYGAKQGMHKPNIVLQAATTTQATKNTSSCAQSGRLRTRRSEYACSAAARLC